MSNKNIYDPLKIEPDILKFWDKNKIFEKRLKKNKGNKTFSFFEGPPTANNEFGVHHALGRTLKDLYLRYKAMQGFDQRRQAGFDAQGLWVEVAVEKELGLKDKHAILDYGLEKFAKKCKERVKHFVDTSWVPLSIKLGMWMDWKGAYITNTDENNEYVWFFLKTAHKKGLLYKGHRSMPWCGRCSCTMAQHEVHMGYKEVSHETVYMKFPIKDTRNEFLLVWTTTPWTVSSNVAVAVHPKLDYVKVKQDDEIYWLSANRLNILKGDYKILKKLKGSELIGKKYESPFDDFEIQKDIDQKIVPWKEVSDSEGTGLVHIAPGCGPEDYELSKKEGLPVVAPLDEDAVFMEGFGWQTGKYALDIDKLATKIIDEKGFLYKKEKYKHNYPHCWRCGEPLVFRVVDQWFVSAKEIQKDLIKQAKQTKWHPEWVGSKRMLPWLENIRDWAVSRTRYYGSPMPIWQCESCKNYDVIGSLAELKEKAVSGISQLKELHRPWIDKVFLTCKKCNSQMKRIEETGDVWMDAGVVPFSTLDYKNNKKYWKKWFPADLIVEMHEQIRGWFYAMSFIGSIIEKKNPYKTVLAHSMVLDETGREMHKSWGNAIFGREALAKMGADPMRWIYCTTKTGVDVRFGYGPAEEAKKKFNILWNLINYFSTHTDLKKISKPRDLNILDKWMLSRLENVKLKVTENLENFNPYGAAKEIENFFIDDFSRTYGQLIRDNLEDHKNAISYIGYTVLLDMLKILAPFVPFITERLYLDNFKNQEKVDSIHLFDWPKADKKLIDLQLEKELSIIKDALKAGLAAREKLGRSLRWPVKNITVVSSKSRFTSSIKKHASLLKSALNALDIETASKMSGVGYDIKLDYKKAGPLFGSEVGKVADYLKNKPASEILSEVQNAAIKLKTQKGNKVKVDMDILIIKELLPKGVIGQQTKDFTVYLDTEETQDMIASGFAREISRKIQDLRKKVKLGSNDKINLEISIDEELSRLLSKQVKDLSARVKAKSIKFASSLSKSNKSIFEIKGKKVGIAISKV